MSSGITPELRWHAVGAARSAWRACISRRLGKVERQRAHAGRLLPPAVARVAHPAAVHGDRHARRLRCAGVVPGGGVTGQAGRCDSRSRGRCAWRNEPTPQEAAGAGPADAGSAVVERKSRAARERASGSSSVSGKSHTSLDPVLGPPAGLHRR